MSEPRTGEKLIRPRQVTLAGWLIVLGSIGVVLTVFSQVSSLNSLDTTRALEEALTRPPADGLGITVSEAQLALRISAMVAGACAAAAAILGWQVLQRSRSARLALAVLAVPLFVTGVASGGLLSSIVVASAVMLWLQPARDWFAGRQPAALPARPTAPPRSQPADRPEAPAGRAEAPSQPPTPSSHPSQPPPAATPYAAPAEPLRHVGTTGSLPPDAAPRRPVQVVWACVLTWVGTGLLALVMTLSVLVLLAAPDRTLDELARQNPQLDEQGISLDTIRIAATVTAGVLVGWCVLAAVLATLVWRGRSWAQVALVVSAAVAGVLCLVGVLLNPVLVVPLAVCAVTVGLLVRAETRWWLRAIARPEPR